VERWSCPASSLSSREKNDKRPALVGEAETWQQAILGVLFVQVQKNGRQRGTVS
jgi:hypothetical protein